MADLLHTTERNTCVPVLLTALNGASLTVNISSTGDVTIVGIGSSAKVLTADTKVSVMILLTYLETPNWQQSMNTRLCMT